MNNDKEKMTVEQKFLNQSVIFEMVLLDFLQNF